MSKIPVVYLPDDSPIPPESCSEVKIALQVTHDLWHWIARNRGAYWRASKHAFGPTSKLTSHCGLCEFAGWEGCHKCPLYGRWPRADGSGVALTCMRAGSTYEALSNHGSLEAIERNRVLAQMIADAAAGRLLEILAEEPLDARKRVK